MTTQAWAVGDCFAYQHKSGGYPYDLFDGALRKIVRIDHEGAYFTILLATNIPAQKGYAFFNEMLPTPEVPM